MLQTPRDATEGLAQVQRLATELAARMRYAQIVERPLPPEQVAALVAAARLLQERGEPWPGIVGEVLRHVAEDLSKEPPGTSGPAHEPEAPRAVTGLRRFFSTSRQEPTQAPRD